MAAIGFVLSNSMQIPALTTVSEESLDNYWTTPAPVQSGTRTIVCLFRFETTYCGNDGDSKSLQDTSDRPLVYTLWLSSQDDPSLYYCCRMDIKQDKLTAYYGARTPSILKKMVDGASLPSQDTKHTEISLFGENEMGLFIRSTSGVTNSDAPSAIRLALSSPNGTEWKKHLLGYIETLRSDLYKERWQRELLEKDAANMKMQIEQIERNRIWQEKELELLYTMIQQVPTGNANGDEDSASYLSPTTSTEHFQQAEVFPAETIGTRNMPKDDQVQDKRTSRSKIDRQNEELFVGVSSLLSCALCPGEVTLRDRDCIKEHFIDRHLDDEKGRCRACPELASRVDPVTHMMAHLNKVYACEFCGKKGRKHYLKAHIRIHTGEKPYKCDKCARSFADSSTYRRHQMVHTGVKKYSCPICGRWIARKDNVKTHIRSHTRNVGTSDVEVANLIENSGVYCQNVNGSHTLPHIAPIQQTEEVKHSLSMSEAQPFTS